MKKIAALLMFLLILLTSCSSNEPKQAQGYGYKDKVVKIEPECTYDLYDIAVDSNAQVYVADKEQIHVFDNGGEKLFSIKKPLVYCTRISISDSVLYAYDENDGLLKLFSLKGKHIRNLKPGITGQVLKLEVVKDKVFILSRLTGKTEEIQLQYYDNKTGKTEKLYIEDLMGFTKGAGDSILVAKPDKAKEKLCIAQYDYSQKKEIKVLDESVNFYDFSFNVKDDTLYYSNQGKIYIFENGIKDKAKDIFNAGSDEVELNIKVSGDFCYAYNYTKCEVYKIRISDI